MVSCVATTPMRQPVAPKYLENEYTRIVFCGHIANSEVKSSAKVPYTSSVRIEVARKSEHSDKWSKQETA